MTDGAQTRAGTAGRTIDQRCIDVVRGLAMDAPEAARSGHQGTAMALAPVAHVLFTRVMTHDPAAPDWFDRDRFVLSAGHASILLYSALHLTGYDVTLDDLRAFRQWGSRTPGHPERGHTSGVEVTTGPLGQGFANGVGMAIAERSVRARFGADVCDHRIFAICSDGDLMEGVSHEAASLAGHLGLGRLVYVYDDNGITIDGRTDLAFSDDTAARFRAYGWHVVDAGEPGDDVDAIEATLREAIAEDDRPSLVVLRTKVGYPSPAWTDHHKAHGNPFDADEIARTKELMGLPPDQQFHVPADVAEHCRAAASDRGRAARAAWEERVAAFAGDRAELEATIGGVGLAGWDAKLPTWEEGRSLATRVASQQCLAAVADVVPGLVSGGADLTGNTGTTLEGADAQSAANPGGRQLYFGVREHAMGSALVGMALHGGAIPVGGTFLVFSDYARPAVRLAALSRAKAVFAWSHDSVGVGEDGPTHQPVEHVMSLRAIPDLPVFRPADANEVAGAWRAIIDGDGPAALICTRQDVPVLSGTAGAPVERGAYVLADRPTGDGGDQLDVVLIGTGSEVQLCLAAAEVLAGDGVGVRVVSMPCWERFEAQDTDYQASVLPDGPLRLSVEAGVTLGWHRWADDALGIDRFGASAPGDEAMERLGINAEAVVARARTMLDRHRKDRP